MQKKIFITLLIVLQSLLTNANEITIEGYSVKHKGWDISLETYEDYFSYKTNTLAQSKISSENGYFEIKVKINSTQKAWLRIGNVAGLIYVSPKTEKYKVFFPEFEYSKNPLKQEFVNLIFEDLPINDINTLILEYNYRLDKLLYVGEYEDEFTFMNDSTFKYRLDTFKLGISKIYKDINDAYFYNYARYSISGLELVADGGQSIKQKYLVFNEHIDKEPILYNHDMYMDFFHQFYNSELNGSNKEKRYKLHNAIVLGKFTEALAAIEKQYTKREDIKELVLLKTMGDAYYSEEYDKKTIKLILDSLYQNTKFEEIKKITRNYYDEISKIEVGSLAPNFKFKNIKGEIISLEDLRGKPVYINFTSTQCTMCLSETNAIKNLEEKYGKSIEFLSVYIDYDIDDFSYYIKNHEELKWHMAYYNKSHTLLEAYKIKTIPTYYLLDADGRILQSPALKPIPVGDLPSISETLYKLSKINTTRRTQRVGEP